MNSEMLINILFKHDLTKSTQVRSSNEFGKSSISGKSSQTSGLDEKK